MVTLEKDLLWECESKRLKISSLLNDPPSCVRSEETNGNEWAALTNITSSP